MTPYYQDEAVTIYHGDALDLLPSMAADVLITDPPYGVEFSGKATKHTTKKSGGYIGDDNEDAGPRAVELALNVVTRGAVFPGTRNLMKYPVAEDIGCVFCPSGAGIGRWGFTLFHPILFYGKRPSTKLYPSSREGFETSDTREHPCAKPLAWLRWLVGLTCAAGDVVIDPFCGSGTTLSAAKQLGHKSIGIDREERYLEIAASRCSQGALTEMFR